MDLLLSAETTSEGRDKDTDGGGGGGRIKKIMFATAPEKQGDLDYIRGK